jgi:hypothetical protein
MAMRPDPHDQRDPDASGRIIYLGDVRRRKGKRRQSPDHHYLAALALVAVVAWAAWTVVVFTLAPSKLLTYLAFFAPLSLAVASTCTLAAYLIERWREGYASLRAAARRGALAAALVVLNLSALAAHHWSIYLGALSILAAVAVDVIATRRASSW